MEDQQLETKVYWEAVMKARTSAITTAVTTAVTTAINTSMEAMSTRMEAQIAALREALTNQANINANHVNLNGREKKRRRFPPYGNNHRRSKFQDSNSDSDYEIPKYRAPISGKS